MRCGGRDCGEKELEGRDDLLAMRAAFSSSSFNVLNSSGSMSSEIRVLVPGGTGGVIC